MTRSPLTASAGGVVDEVEALFREHIREVAFGVIDIVDAAREPGLLTLVAVTPAMPGIDAAAPACIGKAGRRIRLISDVWGETIGVVEYDPDPIRYVVNAVSAPVLSVTITDRVERKLTVVTDIGTPFAHAIGKCGSRARLASQLTGWRIQVCTPLCDENHCTHPGFVSAEPR
ncbi:hypothetical protein [Mycobacterium talmoniae]|uniref:Uncharacterized protein n=1 Tax=Mycobacterium talmoniae TaxID=1858794 RepID=A0A1S1NLP5_9MYCO|nr:hypothetical protein [Mycobacterium talmoniae]OHV03696.1 hypothetical protein BKN37_13565 [Mycobacterium talmoniae]